MSTTLTDEDFARAANEHLFRTLLEIGGHGDIGLYGVAKLVKS
jgi:hypothetical protein